MNFANGPGERMKSLPQFNINSRKLRIYSRNFHVYLRKSKVSRNYAKIKNPFENELNEISYTINISIEINQICFCKAGLSITNGTIDIRLLKSDPRKVEEFLEEQRPRWKPGEENRPLFFQHDELSID